MEKGQSMSRRLISLLLGVVMCGSLIAVGPAPASAGADTCTSDVSTCKVGDVGPGGGIVFYDAGKLEYWGRYLEAKTTSVLAKGIWGSVAMATATERLTSKLIGSGRTNSATMISDTGSVVARLKDSVFKDGFFLPSKDELDALYNYWKISGDKQLIYSAAPMWTSSQASEEFVWYQLFQDGTQFTDANGIIPGLTGNKQYLKSPEHSGSGFKPAPFQVIGISAFPLASTITYFEPVTATTANTSCSAGGANTMCNIGDIGPGGGIVFYDAGKDEFWGRYLEMAPQACEGVKLPWRPVGNAGTIYKDSGGQTAAQLRLLAKGKGLGKINTRVITLALGEGSYAAKYADDLSCGGRDDWFLPSKDELDIAYNRLAQGRIGGQNSPIGGFNKGYYWTSTDYNNLTAWSQYFMDGQQFDRVQTLSGNRNPPANPFRVRPIRAFGTNTVVLTCAQGGVCKIGDTGPGGGTVFYVAPDLFMANGKRARYLEAAAKDYGDSKWACSEGLNKNLETKIEIGEGAHNTALIKKACPGFYSALFTGGGGKSDWFIPSIHELIELSKNKTLFGNLKDYYWSSSEENSKITALVQNFKEFTTGPSQKRNNFSVRTVRAFG